MSERIQATRRQCPPTGLPQGGISKAIRIQLTPPTRLTSTRNQYSYIKGVSKMPNHNLQGTRVAILVTDGFEQAELIEPRKALDEAGATTQVVSPKHGKVKGW